MAQPRANRTTAIILVAGLVASLIASLASGIPADLPGAALGSEVLLHAERALALFAAYLAVVVVLARAWQGELPYEVSGRGLKYKTRELKEEVEGTIEALIQADEEIVQEVGELGNRIEQLESRE